MLRRFVAIVVAVLMLVPVGTACAQDNWPMFRGDASLSGVAREKLAPPLRVAWSKKIGPTESTAAIVGQTVYCATTNGKLCALNLADGKTKWTFTSVSGFSASPTVAGNTVYIGDEGGVFYALQVSSGKMVYRFATGDKIVSSATPASGGSILFGSWDGRLYCLNAATGKQRWSFKTDAQVNATPCVVGGVAIIAGCDSKVRAIDLKTGRQRAALEVGGNIGASPASADGNIYVGSLSGIYLGMHVGGTKSIWKMREHEDGAACYASAAVTPAAVIFGSRSNRIFRVNPQTGKAVWASPATEQVNSSPVISGPIVWIGCDDGLLRALDLATGKPLWQFTTGAQIKASPAIGQGRLVIGASDGMMYCLKG